MVQGNMQSPTNATNEEDSKKDFLLKGYELKVGYRTDHFKDVASASRGWHLPQNRMEPKCSADTKPPFDGSHGLEARHRADFLGKGEGFGEYKGGH